MRLLVFLTIPAALAASAAFDLEAYRNRHIPKFAKHLTGDDLIDYVNTMQDLWTAKRQPRFEGLSEEVINGMMGLLTKTLPPQAYATVSPSAFMNDSIPDSFDARTKWPDCDSISYIRDQSACGSCWAFGAVEAMSDRICIASQGKIQVELSAGDLLACCDTCGLGCGGGGMYEAWQYWNDEGIVTGGNYACQSGCRPYPFPECEHHNNKTHYPACSQDTFPTPQCVQKCQANYTQHSYEDDKYYGKSVYALGSSVEALQREIMTFGPIEVGFDVYADFLQYTGGVYSHIGGGQHGGHAVRMMGWGVCEKTGAPYWLLANSWNADWGENGYFRMLRGVDECGIESDALAGLPKL